MEYKLTGRDVFGFIVYMEEWFILNEDTNCWLCDKLEEARVNNVVRKDGLFWTVDIR